MRERKDRYFLRGCFADDGTANAGSGGVTFRLLQDAGLIDWPACVPSYVTGGSAGAWTLQYVDGTHGLPVAQQGTWNVGTVTAVTAISNALPSGTNVIGHVIADTGSTTAVTQATGTNLHMVVDSGTVTTVSTVTSLSQFAGTAIDVNSGNKGNGTLRVVLATDQPQLTAKLLVTPDANSAVNVAQVGGTNTVTGGVNGTLAVGGNVATNVAIGTNPINNGAQAVSSENTAVTTGRMVQLVADLVGKLIVSPYSNPENLVSGAITSAMTGTTSTSLIAAPAAGLRNYITQITVSNAHATVGTDIVIQDGNAGTTLYTIPAAAVYGGAAITFPAPLRQPTTATAIYVANVTTGASTKASASGYKGA